MRIKKVKIVFIGGTEKVISLEVPDDYDDSLFHEHLRSLLKMAYVSGEEMPYTNNHLAFRTENVLYLEEIFE